MASELLASEDYDFFLEQSGQLKLFLEEVPDLPAFEEKLRKRLDHLKESQEDLSHNNLLLAASFIDTLFTAFGARNGKVNAKTCLTISYSLACIGYEVGGYGCLNLIPDIAEKLNETGYLSGQAVFEVENLHKVLLSSLTIGVITKLYEKKDTKDRLATFSDFLESVDLD